VEDTRGGGALDSAGAVVGYNGTFVATEPMRLALVAAGYADGLDRRFGNRFSLLVHGARAPLVGRISMDMAVVDVTEIEESSQGRGGNPGNARRRNHHRVRPRRDHGTIPWRFFTRIGAARAAGCGLSQNRQQRQKNRRGGLIPPAPVWFSWVCGERYWVLGGRGRDLGASGGALRDVRNPVVGRNIQHRRLVLGRNDN